MGLSTTVADAVPRDVSTCSVDAKTGQHIYWLLWGKSGNRPRWENYSPDMDWRVHGVKRSVSLLYLPCTNKTSGPGKNTGAADTHHSHLEEVVTTLRNLV